HSFCASSATTRRPASFPTRRSSDLGTHPVHDHRQRAGGGHPGVLLPQRPGGGVARVGERWVFGFGGDAFVEFFELPDRHEDLTAYLQQLRCGAYALVETFGDHLDGADVEGDVLTHPAVTPGGRAYQAATFVDQVDGEPVDLELAQVVFHRYFRGGPVGPGVELLGVEGVAEAFHPHQVFDLGEVHADGCADLLCG